jgi:hypothetical protein
MPTGEAIHIGLDRVDPSAYTGWSGALDACENDARAMADITHRLGYRSQLLLTRQATATAVLGLISRAASSLRTGDICVITYAGHGGRFADLSGDEPDHKDETWLLYDREILDDEIHAALSGFAAGVRVVVVSDSCHSGSVVRERYEQYLRERAFREPYLQVAPGLPSRSRAPSRSVEPVIREAPGDVQEKVLAEHRGRYRSARASTPPADNLPLAASVILLAACQDNQVSLEFDGHGAFTAALLDQWDGSHFAEDYRALTTSIRRALPATQVPGLLAIGGHWPAFEQQRALTLDSPGQSATPSSTSQTPSAEPTQTPGEVADQVLRFSVDLSVSSSSPIGVRLLELLAGT